MQRETASRNEVSLASVLLVVAAHESWSEQQTAALNTAAIIEIVIVIAAASVDDTGDIDFKINPASSDSIGATEGLIS